MQFTWKLKCYNILEKSLISINTKIKNKILMFFPVLESAIFLTDLFAFHCGYNVAVLSVFSSCLWFKEVIFWAGINLIAVQGVSSKMIN